MIPIYDDNPTRSFPLLTITFIACNIAAFIFEVTREPGELSALIVTYGFVPARFFAEPLSTGNLFSLLTAMFLHGGWLHLGGNMLYLWIFGNNIEDRLGKLRFVAFYLGCGVLASLAQAFIDPASTVPLVGASGAIAGVLGAYLVLYPRARVVAVIPIFFIIELATIPAVFVIGLWFLLQLAQGIGSIGMMSGVAWWAHVGGFVAGMLAVAPLAASDLIRRARDRRRRRRRSAT
ncbi:MAG: rhomboid family intramembrane serine protease [Coriobacteriia bacterium]|nr:rhomboid family intramembrane serine protease [Coriobacteriia bacterium]